MPKQYEIKVKLKENLKFNKNKNLKTNNKIKNNQKSIKHKGIINSKANKNFIIKN